MVYRRSIIGLLLLALIGLGVEFYLLPARSIFHAWGRLLLTAALVIQIVHEVIAHEHLNRPNPRAPLYPTLGAANVLTLFRGVLIAFLAGFLVSGLPPKPFRWVPGFLFTTAILLDFLDGIVARLTRRPSLLGQHLDMHLDSIGVLVAALLVVRIGHMPWWYALVGLARYLFLLGEALLRRAHRPLHPLPPSPTRRLLAGSQMVFLAVALYPQGAHPGVRLVGTFLSVPFLLGFVRDFLAVAGWTGNTLARRLNSDLWPQGILSLVRWGTGLLLLVYTWRVAPVLSAHMTPLSVFGHLLLAFLLVGGVLVRLNAALLLAIVAVHVTFMPEHVWHLLLLIGGTTVFLGGGGRYSLWTPDDTLFLKRLGAR